jgi:hypothetical protein
LGKITNTITDKLSEDIYNMRDISDLESKRLGELLQLQDIQSIFVSNGSSSLVGHYASKFGHFRTLLQLLTWSFADIMEHFRMGALSDFTTDQLVYLFKALFSDSPLRQGNIDEVTRKHA